MSDLAIDIRNVVKRYDQYTAVSDLSLAVPRGSVYGLLGPNGAGKTTTIRMILNIIVPDSGSITLLGSPHRENGITDRIGYLPEERGLYKKMQVRRVLRFLAELKGMKRRDADQRIDEWLRRLDLKNDEKDWGLAKVDELSRGMQQKVQFIGTLVHDPDLVILDEPFSGLDPVNADVLRDAVLELRARGTTIVFSTHDMSAAERLCDRIFMIFKGKKVLDGTLDEIQSAYGFDTVRVRTDGGRAALDGLGEIVSSVNDHGNLQEVRVNGDPQAFLQRLVTRTAVHHFEITRPSLHDIFVRIARPDVS
jgi:ABC-2 type transport system ATP-binding protein